MLGIRSLPLLLSLLVCDAISLERDGEWLEARLDGSDVVWNGWTALATLLSGDALDLSVGTQLVALFDAWWCTMEGFKRSGTEASSLRSSPLTES